VEGGRHLGPLRSPGGAQSGRGHAPYTDLVDDRAVVEWQIGRTPRAFRRVACRCVHGFPAVSEQEALPEDGAPFPTTYWLSCPWLVAAISRVEASGGVRRFSRLAAEDPELARSLAEADAEQRRLRPELDVGIAGSRDPGKLKCLHAHAAFALARPGYELGERILDEAGERWCHDVRCTSAVADRSDGAP
jgi:uncharacterized protein